MGRKLHGVFHRCGFDIIRYPAGTSDGIDFFTAATALGADTVIDVGANVGHFGSMLRSRGYEGRIVSFEPGQRAFARLERVRSGDPLWSAHRLALGATDEDRTLLVPRQSVLASFLPVSPRGLRHFGTDVADPRAERVEVRRLDSIFGELVGSAGRIMLKVDAQGWDQQVLEGAVGVIERIVGIQTEIATGAYYEEVPEYLARLHWLDERGYQPVGFTPAGGRPGFWEEFDCLFARRRDLDSAGDNRGHAIG